MSNREEIESTLRARLDRNRSAYLEARDQYEKSAILSGGLRRDASVQATRNTRALRAYTQALKSYNRIFFSETDHKALN